jgi:hypothetical protein
MLDWIDLPTAQSSRRTDHNHQQVYLHPYPMLLMLRNHVWDQRRTDGMICMVVENPPGGYPPNPPGGYPPNPPDGRYVWGLFCV